MTGFGRIEEAQGGGHVRRQQRRATRPGRRSALGLLGQVVARRERPTGALEDDDPDAPGRPRRRRARPAVRRPAGRQGVELGRPIEGQPDAPRRRRSNGGARSRRRSSCRPSLGPGPPGRRPRPRPVPVAMTGLRSISSDVRAIGPEPAERDDAASATAARSIGRPTADAVEEPAPRRSSSIAQRRARRHRGEPDRDVVEDLGEDAAETDDDGRPERGSRRSPTMSSSPGSAIGSTSRPRTSSRRWRACSSRSRRGRRGPRRRRAGRARRRRGRSCGRARPHRA